MTYKLLYCAKINDDKHAGMLKVGDTDFVATKLIASYQPNDPELVKAAQARIAGWSGTAAAGAELVYCEALIRYNPQTQNHESYRDGSVHKVLQHAGFPKVDFDSALDNGTEWFKVDLATVQAAIKATKEFRDYLDTSELPAQTIYDLREEQRRAVDETTSRFKKKNDMLWHAKMRFGKTITALNLVKETPEFKRTIIITHRPVVEDSWGSDFYHVFAQEDSYAFLTKIQDADMVLSDDQTDEAIDRANDARLAQLVAEGRKFVYFASIQDLRGSKRVGGQFDKNNVVFDIDWDFVIIDEAHEGTKTALGQKVINLLIKEKTKKLDLSGTAYNLFDQYTEKGSVFTWDYVMEQEAKKSWPMKHPGEKNPYEDMPVMHINTFDLEKALREGNVDLSGKTFSFREFFRTWTGDLSKDGQPIPAGREVGDFVHPAAVRRFLDLLSINDENSRFPYVTKAQCNQNAHSLWMVPGVREAAALSKMLKKHPLFGQESLFGIANVAGEGDHDEEKNYHNALELVRKTIEKHPNSITLSCGRLTTGVTVKEWTSVFMLSGSDTTDAKNYMQTIFRVQSAGKINGVQKKDAFVYDFAPDRALMVVAASVLGSRKGKGGTVVSDDERHSAFSDFLSFCPIVAIDGAEFKPFSVEALVSQINRVQIDRALRTGFMDNGIYDMAKFKVLSPSDIDKMNTIFQKLKETKNKGQLGKAGMAQSDVTGKTPKTPGTPGSQKPPTQKEKKEQKELERNILERLRTISIRIPLLFFGGDFELEEGRLGEAITSIDPASWKTFMPENLTKDDFRALVKYYNQETVIGAAKVIRAKALEADSLPPTERVIAITEIFSHFHNPSKETVLTPWRVVNMHMAETLGGWCFYNEAFEENDDEYYRRLIAPRFVNQGDVTDNTVNNPDATILEINSKSGLYPLYVTYSLYRAKLGDRKESDLLPEELIAIWDSAVSQVYVLCQSKMARSITNRTLTGFRAVDTNVKYDDKLLDNLKESIEKTAKRIIKGSYWGVEVKEMKFDAVVGNPPYQEQIGGASPPPIYHYFVEAATALQPAYLSMITPSRWLTATSGVLVGYRSRILDGNHFKNIVDFQDATDCFQTVEIKGGVSYFLWDRGYTGQCLVTTIDANGSRISIERPLIEEGMDTFIRDGRMLSVLEKVKNFDDTSFASLVSANDPFGYDSREEHSSKRVKVQFSKTIGDNDIPFYYNGWRKEGLGYIGKDTVKRNADAIEKAKVFIPKAWGVGNPSKDSLNPFIPESNAVCTETYLMVGPFESLEMAENCCKYIQTRFFHLMVSFIKSTQNTMQKAYSVVPLQNFGVQSDIDWSQTISEIDRQLYKKYSFTPEEIEQIESTIKIGE